MVTNILNRKWFFNNLSPCILSTVSCILILFITPLTSFAIERDLSIQRDQYGLSSSIERWAVVIGITRYQDERINKENPLRFAHRDAEAFYNFLRSPKGGGFDKEHTLLLLNENATLFAMRRAFNHFLAKANENDLVVIYFAGHGVSETDDPSNLFLLPYDTDINLMRATGYPMDEINYALQRYIKAKRVVL